MVHRIRKLPTTFSECAVCSASSVDPFIVNRILRMRVERGVRGEGGGCFPLVCVAELAEGMWGLVASSGWPAGCNKVNISRPYLEKTFLEPDLGFPF